MDLAVVEAAAPVLLTMGAVLVLDILLVKQVEVNGAMVAALVVQLRM